MLEQQMHEYVLVKSIARVMLKKISHYITKHKGTLLSKTEYTLGEGELVLTIEDLPDPRYRLASFDMTKVGGDVLKFKIGPEGLDAPDIQTFLNGSDDELGRDAAWCLKGTKSPLDKVMSSNADYSSFMLPDLNQVYYFWTKHGTSMMEYRPGCEEANLQLVGYVIERLADNLSLMIETLITTEDLNERVNILKIYITEGHALTISLARGRGTIGYRMFINYENGSESEFRLPNQLVPRTEMLEGLAASLKARYPVGNTEDMFNELFYLYRFVKFQGGSFATVPDQILTRFVFNPEMTPYLVLPDVYVDIE